MRLRPAIAVAFALPLLLACSHAQPAPAPVEQPRAAANAPAVQDPAPVAQPVADDGFRVEYRPQSSGRTVLEVVEPQGADVQVYDGGTQVAHDRSPMSFDAQADKFYRVEVRLPSGSVRERKVAARAGMVGAVSLAAGRDAGPQPMARSAFRDLVNSIDRESGDAAKLAMLKTAASYNWFSTAMVGVLLEHIVYRENKLAMIPLLKDRILDRQVSYRLLEHFTYREDKAQVEAMLQQ